MARSYLLEQKWKVISYFDVEKQDVHITFTSRRKNRSNSLCNITVASK